MNNISITIVENDNRTVLEFEISNDELSILKDFFENFESLERTDVVKNGLITQFKLNYEHGKGLSFSSKLPTDDEIAVFLHRMRHFILNNECCSYNSVTGIIGRRIKDDRIKKIIKRQRTIYDGRKYNDMISIYHNEVLLTSDTALFDWVNAYEYHSDRSKRIQIEERFKNIGGLDAAKALYLSMLTEKLKAISAIAGFIKMLTIKDVQFFGNA